MTLEALLANHPMAYLKWAEQYPEEVRENTTEFRIAMGYVIATRQDMVAVQPAVYDPTQGRWYDGEASDDDESRIAGALVFAIGTFFHS